MVRTSVTSGTSSRGSSGPCTRDDQTARLVWAIKGLPSGSFDQNCLGLTGTGYKLPSGSLVE